MKVVYIIGPYRAATPNQVLANISRAREAALEVWKSGAVALCPHLNTALFDGECPDEVWLEGDKELLRRCDAALVVGKWTASQGSRCEVRHALQRDKPVFDDVGKLWSWLRNGILHPSDILQVAEALERGETLARTDGQP